MANFTPEAGKMRVREVPGLSQECRALLDFRCCRILGRLHRYMCVTTDDTALMFHLGSSLLKHPPWLHCDPRRRTHVHGRDLG